MVKFFLKKFFYNLNIKNISYVVLRNHDKLPYSIEGSDIDLLVSREAYLKISKSILNELTDIGYRAWKVYRKNFGLIQRSFVPVNCERPSDVIRIDFHIGEVQWLGKPIIPAKILWENVDFHGQIRILSYDYSAMLSTLNSLLYSGQIKDKYLAQWNSMAEEKKQEALKHITVGTSELETLLSLKLSSVRKKFIFNSSASVVTLFKGMYSWLRTMISRLLKPPGNFVALIGPDGSGKSTLAEMIKTDCVLMYPGISYFHLFPKLKIFRKIDRKSHLRWEKRQGTGKSEMELRNQKFGFISSLLRLGYLWLRFTLGYFLAIVPEKLKGKLVISDRWCYDIMLDPGSKGIHLPSLLRKFVLFFIPKPDGMILLSGDPQILANRKQDLNKEEIDRQIKDMNKLFGNTDKSACVYTDQDPEYSFKQALQFLVR